MPTIQFTSINGTQESINFDTSAPGWIAVNGSYLNPANSVHIPVISIIQNYLAIDAPTTQQTYDFALSMDAIDWRSFGSYTDGNEALENTFHDLAVKYESLLFPPPPYVMPTIQFTSIDGTQETISFDTSAPGWIAVNGSYLNPGNPVHVPVISIIQNYFAIEKPTTQETCDFALKMDAIDWRWFGSYTEANEKLENTFHDLAVKYASLLAPAQSDDSKPDAIALTNYEYLNHDWHVNNGTNLVGKTFLTIEPSLGLAQVTYGVTKYDQTWVQLEAFADDPLAGMKLDMQPMTPVI